MLTAMFKKTFNIIKTEKDLLTVPMRPQTVKPVHQS